MYKWNQDLYLVSEIFKNFYKNRIMSKKEVQEFIKNNYNATHIININNINYTLGEQLNFKDFVPKCHQKPYKKSMYRDKNIWLKIWNNIK